jgi:hypothetical protein
MPCWKIYKKPALVLLPQNLPLGNGHGQSTWLEFRCSKKRSLGRVYLLNSLTPEETEKSAKIANHLGILHENGVERWQFFFAHALYYYACAMLYCARSTLCSSIMAEAALWVAYRIIVILFWIRNGNTALIAACYLLKSMKTFKWDQKNSHQSPFR